MGSKQVLGPCIWWKEGRGGEPRLSFGKGTYFPAVMYPGSLVCREVGRAVGVGGMRQTSQSEKTRACSFRLPS